MDNNFDFEGKEDETGTIGDNLVFMMIELLQSPDIYSRTDILRIAESMHNGIPSSKLIGDPQAIEFAGQVSKYRNALEELENAYEQRKNN